MLQWKLKELGNFLKKIVLLLMGFGRRGCGGAFGPFVNGEGGGGGAIFPCRRARRPAKLPALFGRKMTSSGIGTRNLWTAVGIRWNSRTNWRKKKMKR